MTGLPPQELVAFLIGSVVGFALWEIFKPTDGRRADRRRRRG
jgi:hypothetical protein